MCVRVAAQADDPQMAGKRKKKKVKKLINNYKERGGGEGGIANNYWQTQSWLIPMESFSGVSS